jgi:hypothetical protein
MSKNKTKDTTVAHNEPGSVYVIYDATRQICKIGCSKSPEKRVKTIITATYITKFSYYISKHVQDCRLAEYLVHKELFESKKAKEWFKCSLSKAKEVIDQKVEHVNALPLYKSPFSVRDIVFATFGPLGVKSFDDFQAKEQAKDSQKLEKKEKKWTIDKN